MTFNCMHNKSQVLTMTCKGLNDQGLPIPSNSSHDRHPPRVHSIFSATWAWTSCISACQAHCTPWAPRHPVPLNSLGVNVNVVTSSESYPLTTHCKLPSSAFAPANVAHCLFLL